jgi:hypothetical protein
MCSEKHWSLDIYSSDVTLPEKLYRVTHLRTRSRVMRDALGDHNRGDMVACKRSFVTDDVTDEEDDFTKSIKDHINWYCRKPSPWMSTFDSLRAARSWASGQTIDAPVKIYTIVTSCLPDDCVVLFMEVLKKA